MLLQIILPLFLGLFLQTPTFDPSASVVTYAMRHKLHAWEGTSNHMNITSKWNDKNKLDEISILVKVSSFNSGITSRDNHMLEVLDVLRNPNITFSSTSITYTTDGILVKGKLQFHGVTRDVQTVVKLQRNANNIKLSGSLPVLLEDYKVTRPSLLFVKADNLIQIRFQCTFIS
jgi:polyisoprenoid-binding protein YceI